MLNGITIDFVETATSSGLSFIDPNKEACACSTRMRRPRPASPRSRFPRLAVAVRLLSSPPDAATRKATMNADKLGFGDDLAAFADSVIGAGLPARTTALLEQAAGLV